MCERCLIVEDDAELGGAFAEVLSLSGLNTELARDGRAALDMLAAAKPDMVILDLHLPEVSGPTVLDYIQSEERLKGTRVVIVSADVRRAEQLRERVDLVLVKPVGFAELFGLADRLFND